MGRRVAVLLVLGAAGCAILRPEPPLPAVVGGVQVGVASWYGPGFDGRPTASGEPFDQWALTAAHRTLPLGTRVLVTSIENGRAIEVRINDRGPFAHGRIIDLSRRAAESLHMVGPGVMQVRLEVLGTPAREHARPEPVRGRDLRYVVQLGAFSHRRPADSLRNDLSGLFPEAHVSRRRSGWSEFYRVRVGPFADRDDAEERAAQAARLGYTPIILRTTSP